MRYFLCLLTVSGLAQAQRFTERTDEAYKKTDQNFDLSCAYSRSVTSKVATPTGQTFRALNTLSREFILETETRSIPLSLSVLKTDRDMDYSFTIDKRLKVRGDLVKRDFSVSGSGDPALDREFELSKLVCHITLAEATPVKLASHNYHFNIHPHTIYDYQKRLKTVVEDYLKQPNYDSLIFLDTGNFRGDLVSLSSFMSGQDSELPKSAFKSDLTDVSESIPLVVSPAGNNRFQFETDGEVNITYTGGNHNYCIWNNTRNVLIGLLNSKSRAHVIFHYDQRAIVAQQRGMEGLSLSFSKQSIQRSNLLKDLLQSSSIQENYHFSYLVYFRNLFAQEYAGMYKSLKFIYDAEGYHETFTVEGQGTRDLVVEFKYF